MADNQQLNPNDYADDPRVSFLVAEWNRLTQAEKDSEELVEVDPTMKELAEKEIEEIAQQKEALMKQMSAIIGDPNERE
ncbi:MAG TPA: hypothetical protein VHD38_00515 [Candidatus Paceibacterota bacterium]|nr:hypothetical protein [Candidatus Paceibacterota bacterium]